MHEVAHDYDNHNASLSEGAPWLLWSGPCLESLTGGGLARIPRVGCDARGRAVPGVSLAERPSRAFARSWWIRVSPCSFVT